MAKRKHKRKLSRRKFVKNSACAGLGMATFYNTFFNLQMANAAAAGSIVPPTDYKALVCILMSGGNDSYNMLAPLESTEYNNYNTVRSNMAIASEDFLPITAASQGGKSYGIHPSMSGLHSLYSSGNLAFIANVGTLVEHVNKADVQADIANVPLGLFSHADQVMHWQTSIPQNRSIVGWGGRMADLLQSMNGNENISMNVSLSGTNIFQAGNSVIEYGIRNYDTGSVGITGYNPMAEWQVELTRTAAVTNLLEHTYQDVFRSTYAGMVNQAQANHEEFSAAIAAVPDFATSFGAGDFSQNLQMVAKTIAARSTLDYCRQVFFIDIGGFDMHDELLYPHTGLLQIINDGLTEFYNCLVELGVQDDVTTFTMSDFARTLTSNGTGTDHAWGGNVMVMGGAVQGGDVYGTYPDDLSLDGPLELGWGGGVLIPTTSCDEYFAELAMWLGVSPSEVYTVLPNIGNFYTPSAGTPPIGFMS